jgi:hypothetical protein
MPRHADLEEAIHRLLTSSQKFPNGFVLHGVRPTEDLALVFCVFPASDPQLCWDWTAGRCRWGDKCKWNHVPAVQWKVTVQHG